MNHIIFRHIAATAITFAVTLLPISSTAQITNAQITLQQITGGAVTGNPERYREISDAAVLFQRGNGQASLKMLQEISRKNPELPPGEVMFAHLCFASQNEKAGRAALQSAVVVRAGDPEAWNMLADLQLRQGHLAEAELIFDKAREVAEAFDRTPRRKRAQLINALAGLARTNELRKQWETAEPYLLEWQKFDQENLNVYRRLAAAQLNLGQYDEARETLNQLREIDPDQLPAEVTLGTIYQSLGKTEEAAEIMKTAIVEHGEEFATRIAIGRWALDAGDLQLARSCADKAAALDSGSVLPALLLATADLLDHKLEDAEQQFRTVYDKKPGNFDAVNGLATSLLAQDAAEKNRQGLELARVNAQANRDLKTVRGRQSAGLFAWGLYRTGSQDEALKLIQPVIISGQITPDLGYYAAGILNAAGQKDLATELLNKTLESDARFAFRSEAKQLLNSLQAK